MYVLPLSVLGNKCVDRITREHRRCRQVLGIMSPYGSEGPSAYERREIKKTKKHGLQLMSLNKSSIVSAMDYMRESTADIVFIQELNQKTQKFLKTKSIMKKGVPTPTEWEEGDDDDPNDPHDPRGDTARPDWRHCST